MKRAFYYDAVRLFSYIIMSHHKYANNFFIKNINAAHKVADTNNTK